MGQVVSLRAWKLEHPPVRAEMPADSYLAMLIAWRMFFWGF